MGVVELAQRWRRMVEERDAQVARLRPGAGGPGFWDQRAEGFTLLYEMGIVANVEIVPFGGRRGVGAGGGFADAEETMARFREMLFAGPDPATDQKIRQYLAGRLQEHEGRQLWQGPAMKIPVHPVSGGDSPWRELVEGPA